jgi:hypothetical protein
MRREHEAWGHRWCDRRCGAHVANVHLDFVAIGGGEGGGAAIRVEHRERLEIVVREARERVVLGARLQCTQDMEMDTVQTHMVQSTRP